MTPHPASPPDLPNAVERVAPSVLAVRTRRHGTSTAFAWRSQLLVTAASAVGDATRVQLIGAQGEALAGEVRGVDAATDLAVIAVEVDLPVVERRIDPPLRVADFVFAAGREASGRLHASFGHVGAVGPAWRTWRGGAVDRLVRLDGGLPPGLMGAPLADAAGQVVGLASAALSRHHGIVIPGPTLDRIADALWAHGRVQRGHLGIAVQAVALAAAVREQADVSADTGLLVTGIGDDSPAARAGLLVGDVIVSAGGRAVDTPEALRELLAGEAVGARLRLQLLRGGRRDEVSVEVGEQPRGRGCR